MDHCPVNEIDFYSSLDRKQQIPDRLWDEEGFCRSVQGCGRIVTAVCPAASVLARIRPAPTSRRPAAISPATAVVEGGAARCR
ncbi:hypothetical protein [Methylobacterium nodulans]|uniref:hypothetical protein n=1 Tax=Methylobacterium nodulans TaxID=114616 RepID=UPI0005C1F21E|nr:hypothetical protein [Methylobacterium nodulans]